MKAPKKSESNRQAILENGYALVQKRGFSALGLQELLSASGVPKGSFYHYFDSKEAFGIELLQHYVQSYEQKLPPVMPGETGRVWLLNYFRGWIASDALMQTPGWAEDCLVVKLAAEVSDLSEEMRKTLDHGSCGLIAHLATVVERGRQDGSIPLDRDPDVLAETLYQMWLGAALLARLSRRSVAFERALKMTKELLGPDSPGKHPQT